MVAAQTPMARARSRRSVNVLVMIDIATGLSMDPPMAWTIRKTISQPRPGARLHSSEPTVKTLRPAWKVLRRPMRSAVAPENISRLASTSVYASMIHCRPDTDECSSRPIDGSATFTIVLSRPTMNRLMQQMARTSIRRRGLSSGRAVHLGCAPGDAGPAPGNLC